MAKTAKIKAIVSLLIVFSLVRCASQVSPTGGPPDKTPPEIVEVEPADQTTNFKGHSFKLKFSEYVESSSLPGSIFISPNIEGNLEYDWGGTSVEVKLPDSLKANTTYTVTIGTDVEDANNSNKMASAYTFAFSTGDKIDKGAISGRVIDPAPSGIMIYSYKLEADTLNPAVVKPDYISQTGEDGTYLMRGLANGTYRVFAINDGYKDFLYNPMQDAFGVPFTDIKLDSSKQEFTGMNFYMQIADTSKPRVNNVTMTDKQHMLVEFGEAVDSNKISSKNFYIYDSLNNERVDVTYFYKGRSKPHCFLLAFKDTVTNEESVQLIAQNFGDLSGNVMEMEKTDVVVNDKPDTTQPVLRKFTTQYPDTTIDFLNGWIRLDYDEAFDIEGLAAKAIKVTDAKARDIEYKIEKVDDGSFKVVFEKLKAYTNFVMKVDQKYFADVAGNKFDSVFTYKFKSINSLEFSGISGTVIPPDSIDGDIIVLIDNIDDNTISISQKVDGNGFNIPRVVPGEYFFWSFVDRNSNGKYDKGNIYPFEPSEQFTFFYQDSLNLRPRWPVGDAQLNYKAVPIPKKEDVPIQEKGEKDGGKAH